MGCDAQLASGEYFLGKMSECSFGTNFLGGICLRNCSGELSVMGNVRRETFGEKCPNTHAGFHVKCWLTHTQTDRRTVFDRLYY